MKIDLPKNLGIKKLIPRSGKPAEMPGTINYIGKKRTEEVTMSIIDYNKDTIVEKPILSVEESIKFKKNDSITWLNINGIYDEEVIKNIGEYYNIHSLVLEDITNTTQRAKVEEYDEHIFVVIKMIYFDKENSEITVEQVSILIGDNYLISLQEKKGDIFEGIRNRLRESKGRIRSIGSDYLLYAITDAVVDQYFGVMEKISDKIELLEEQLIIDSNQNILTEIYSLKKELSFLKKSIWPLREVVSNLQKSENKLITENTHLFIRDVYDHTIQVIETVETFRDLTSSMLDLYMSTVSNKMNEVMKVLTIFAAIFIPLTFIAGVYGMNFEFMPELTWKYAYPIWWVVIVIMTIAMLILFKKKKWI